MIAQARAVVLHPGNDHVGTIERHERLGRHRSVVGEAAAVFRPGRRQNLERLLHCLRCVHGCPLRGVARSKDPGATHAAEAAAAACCRNRRRDRPPMAISNHSPARQSQTGIGSRQSDPLAGVGGCHGRNHSLSRTAARALAAGFLLGAPRRQIRAQIVEYPTTGAGPESIVSGPDGALWFTEPPANKIGRITTQGVVTEYALAGNPGPQVITTGADGNLWFTERISSKIGRMTPSGVVTEFPTLTPSAEPVGITAAGDGNLWFTERFVAKIGRITTQGVITEYALGPSTFPNSITEGPGWQSLVQPRRTTPALAGSRRPAHPELPHGTAARVHGGAAGFPREITTGPDGKIWYTVVTPAGPARQCLQRRHRPPGPTELRRHRLLHSERVSPRAAWSFPRASRRSRRRTLGRGPRREQDRAGLDRRLPSSARRRFRRRRAAREGSPQDPRGESGSPRAPARRSGASARAWLEPASSTRTRCA